MGEITLVKSENLVGLKTQKTRSASKPKGINKNQKVHTNLGDFEVFDLGAKGKNIDDKLDDIRKEETVEVGTHVFHTENGELPMVPNGDIYIVFEDGLNAEEQQLVLDEYHLVITKRRGPNKLTATVTENSPNPIKTSLFLQKSSLVRFAEPDLDAPLQEYFPELVQPSDVLYQYQWYFKNDGNMPDTNLPERMEAGQDSKIQDAWNRLGNRGSKEITIAVVDNGFDNTHPDLKPALTKPFDFWTNSAQMETGQSTHGTACAGLAVARDNGNGIVGVAPNSKYMPLGGVAFSLKRTEDIFDYCINNKADVISCSWGTTRSEQRPNSEKIAAITKAAREGRGGKGCVVLFAAGNENIDHLNYYATIPDVIAVGACNSEGTHSIYSNRGFELSVCAPSSGVWPLHWPTTTTRPFWDPGRHDETGNKKFWRDGIERGTPGLYKHFGGTSAATPIVAGICALMLSANPDLTAKEVKEILQDTADKIGFHHDYFNGHSVKYGYGRVNADRAVAEALRRREGGIKDVENSVRSGKGLFRFSVSRHPSEGFGVQAGVFAQYGNVLLHVEKVQKLFRQHNILVNINELHGKTVYKVIVGSFSNKSEAQALRGKMKNEGIEGFVADLSKLG